jgi:hypothetical protein
MTPIMQKQPKLHSVQIHVNGSGFAYRGADEQNAVSIRVHEGDHVKWNCDHGNFSILFQGPSPFAEVGAHGNHGSDTPVLTVVGKPGSYKYGVTVALDTGMLVDDPEIIIGDD